MTKKDRYNVLSAAFLLFSFGSAITGSFLVHAALGWFTTSIVVMFFGWACNEVRKDLEKEQKP